jgi:hypothetical protein
MVGLIRDRKRIGATDRRWKKEKKGRKAIQAYDYAYISTVPSS